MSTKRKLAAILSADAAGYSKLMADDDAATLRSLNDARSLFRERIEAHGGRVVDTAGDSVLAEFPSAVEAVHCAVEIQHELAKRNAQLTEHRRMQFRIGINLGDVIEQEDRTIYGDGVNVAARLQALAEPGGICVSGTTFDHVEGKLSLKFKLIGDQQVKNIAKPVRVYRVLFDATPQKPVRAGNSKRRTIVVAIAAVLVLSLGIAWKAYNPVTERSAQLNDPLLAMPSGPAIAVLAFENMSGDPRQDFFGDGIAEEIISGLSRFPNLRVLARNSTFQYKGKAIDVREVGRQLGASYVVEGSVRKAADTVRVTAQLLDASSGAHVWSETFERELTTKKLFEVQDDIVSQVVTRIGDVHGAVNQANIEKLRTKNVASLADYDCVLLAYEYQRFLTPDKHANAKTCLARTVERNPDYADAWANLAYAYVDQYWAEYEGPSDPLVRAHDAARRAVDLDPKSQIARYALANVYFFENDVDGFFVEAERALALNPNNTEVIAALGVRFTYAEKRERGLALIKKAIALNPLHPGWYLMPVVFHHYRNQDYETALEFARRIDMPQFWYTHYFLSAVYGELGQSERAQAAMNDLLKLNPAFKTRPLQYIRMWYKSEEAVQHFAEGFRKAGLEIPAEAR
ncbi:MAG TPA: adenylate/guanylate cyclase domain-containing protein [Burkholderiales bacterium]|nr:adenylate/guanylate cyclase domain-containing protein [Burkholderiales bacterium]